MKGLLTFLSDNEIEQIHEASLRILKETGVKIPSDKVKNMLADNGAEVNGDIVKLPKSVIEEAISMAPKEIILGARDPKCELKVPTEEFTLMSTSGFAPFIDDFETGERRYATSSDLLNFAIIGDYLDSLDYFWPIVLPNDIKAPLQELHSFVITIRNNRKHITCSCTTEKTAQWLVKLASAVAGSESALREKPLFSTINCPVAPLTIEKDSSEAMVVLAKAGIPVLPMTMVLGGTSAPATMAGVLALANAEELACLSIIQYANPGAPMIYCAEASMANMRTGAIDYDAPEYPLICAGAGQMARFYKLPNFVADIAPGDKAPGSASSKYRLETKKDLQYNIASDALFFMTNTDLAATFGSVDEAISSSLSQLVLDAEVYEHARAYHRHFAINDDTLALDVINEVGHGGHFLEMKHTLVHFKKEVWNKKLPHTFVLDSSSAGTFIERAQEKVREILATHKPPQIDEGMDKELTSIVEAAEKDILGE